MSWYIAAALQLLPGRRTGGGGGGGGRRRLGQHYPVDEKLFGLTDKHKQLRQSVFDFAQKELVPKTTQIDRKSAFDGNRLLWREMGRLGLLGITVDKNYGGKEGNYLDQVIIQEELSRACAVSSLSYGVHVNHCITPIKYSGTEEQKRKYLPKLCSGVHVGAMLMSETIASSELMELQAEKQEDHYVFNGNGLANGLNADIFIVYVRTSADIEQGITAFIVEKSFEGLTPSNDAGRIIFQNCKVPVGNVLGEENKGAQVLLNCLELEKLVLAGGPVGIMQACCNAAFGYTHARKRFAEFKDEIADLYAELCGSRSYLYGVARACDNGHINRKDCAAVILHCTESAKQLALSTQELLGKIGSIKNDPSKRLLSDVKLYETCAGNNEKRQEIISLEISEEYAKEIHQDCDESN